MKLILILFASITLAAASLFGGKIVNLDDDGGLIIRNDMGKQVMIPKGMGWNKVLMGNRILDNKLGIRQTTPDMMVIRDISRMSDMPWWMCKDSTCLHQMMLMRSPIMMDTRMFETPTMHGLNRMTEMDRMPWWKCKDQTCLMFHDHMTPRMNMPHMTPMMDMPHMTPMMDMPHMTPMMDMRDMNMMYGLDMKTRMDMQDMTLSDMYNIVRFMNTGRDFPLEDTRMLNGDTTTKDILTRMRTLGHQMNAPRRMEEDLVL